MFHKVIAAAFLALALPIVALIGSVSAQTFKSDQSVTVASGDTVDGSAYFVGSSVDVAGKINGDLYCAGQNITISGEVTGDVLCAGQTVTVSGTVAGNVRLAGQTISLSANVSKNATLAGQTITLQKDGQIEQDATVLGQNVTTNGKIGRDLIVSAATATLNAEIGRNVSADIATLTLGNGAVVNGSLNYTGPEKLSRAEGAITQGKVTYTERKENAGATEAKTYDPFGAILWSLMLVASAVVFALLFPRVLHNATTPSATTVPQALLAILVGFVASIVMPFAIVLLMVTVFGVPFAIVVLLAWILILALSGTFAAYFTGRIVWRQQTNAVLIMLTGAVILAVLLMIPILNVLVGLVAAWYGSGTILMRLKEALPAPSYDMTPQKQARKKA